jgi:hypothetical protein
MKFRAITALTFVSSALVACASTAGAQPADMSAVQHEQAAAGHEDWRCRFERRSIEK